MSMQLLAIRSIEVRELDLTSFRFCLEVDAGGRGLKSNRTQVGQGNKREWWWHWEVVRSIDGKIIKVQRPQKYSRMIRSAHKWNLWIGGAIIGNWPVWEHGLERGGYIDCSLIEKAFNKYPGLILDPIRVFHIKFEALILCGALCLYILSLY